MKYKNVLLYSLVCLLLFVTACGTCELGDGFVGRTTLLELSITVGSADSASFEKIFDPDMVEVRDGFFEATASYDHPEDILPDGLRNFIFFFQHTAVVNGSSIFTNSVGTTTLIYGDIPNEEGVDYFEKIPTEEPGVFTEWRPDGYLGAVEIIGKGKVQFSIVFGKENEWRSLFAVYQFSCGS